MLESSFQETFNVILQYYFTMEMDYSYYFVSMLLFCSFVLYAKALQFIAFVFWYFFFQWCNMVTIIILWAETHLWCFFFFVRYASLIIKWLWRYLKISFPFTTYIRFSLCLTFQMKQRATVFMLVIKME